MKIKIDHFIKKLVKYESIFVNWEIICLYGVCELCITLMCTNYYEVQVNECAYTFYLEKLQELDKNYNGCCNVNKINLIYIDQFHLP